jgi:hypothetical protein
MTKETSKPVKQFRAGSLAVAIFQREHEGKTYYSAVPSRAYTTDDGNTWSYADSYDRDQLPVIAALLQEAFAWIVGQTK